MDEALQWSAVTLVGLALWALVLALRRNSARWSAARLEQTTSRLDPQAGASVQVEPETPTKAPDAALRLTYRGVSYLRWR
ncbi:MAG: hypothetical protein SNJ81_01605 [Cyanobacteriota bacterium]